MLRRNADLSGFAAVIPPDARCVLDLRRHQHLGKHACTHDDRRPSSDIFQARLTCSLSHCMFLLWKTKAVLGRLQACSRRGNAKCAAQLPVRPRSQRTNAQRQVLTGVFPAHALLCVQIKVLRCPARSTSALMVNSEVHSCEPCLKHTKLSRAFKRPLNCCSSGARFLSSPSQAQSDQSTNASQFALPKC